MHALATALLSSFALASVTAIFGGEVVPRGSKTYITSLRFAKGSDTICSGTLITRFHVLTTATCIGQNPTVVAVGTHYFNDTLDGEHIEIASSHSHPKFNRTHLRHDVAIVTLAHPSTFAPIHLPQLNESARTGKAGVWASAMGWGTTDRLNWFGHSEVLRSVDLVVWKSEDCKEATSLAYITHLYLCAGGEEGKGVAFGDHGGPLVESNVLGDGKDVLIGVLTKAVGKADLHIPSVFMRLSTDLKWIHSFLKHQEILTQNFKFAEL